MFTDEEAFDARLAQHAALADPARLRIVDALSIGDLAPSEIQAGLDMTSNLLAHHLGVLEAAHLIQRQRSEADRRRTYVRLAPHLRGTVGHAVLPVPRRIAFICTGNSARSQLAASLWQRESSIPAISAGTRPASAVARGAVQAAMRRGLDFSGTTPRRYADIVRDDDWIVTVCDSAHEALAGTDAVHWSIPDPVRLGTDTAFDQAFDDLAARIGALAPLLRPSTKDAP